MSQILVAVGASAFDYGLLSRTGAATDYVQLFRSTSWNRVITSSFWEESKSWPYLSSRANYARQIVRVIIHESVNVSN